MNFKLVKLSYSGCFATIYAIKSNSDKTTFDDFILENQEFESELADIKKRLYIIGKETGARISYFKENEGKYGDGVCALYDKPNSKLRLYCIRFGAIAVILCGGGPKGKEVRAWQDDLKLSDEANKAIEYAKEIKEAFLKGDLIWSEDKSEILELQEDEEI